MYQDTKQTRKTTLTWKHVFKLKSLGKVKVYSDNNLKKRLELQKGESFVKYTISTESIRFFGKMIGLWTETKYISHRSIYFQIGTVYFLAGLLIFHNHILWHLEGRVHSARIQVS